MPIRRTLLATALLGVFGLAHTDPVLAAAPADASAARAASSVPTGPLPRTVVPSEVALQLKIDPTQPRFSGHVSISVDVAAPTRVIWMHGRNLKIGKAVYMPANGRNQDLTAVEADVSGVLKLSARETIAPGKGVIVIDYDAPFGELQGAYRVKPDGRDYVVTQMEPLGARYTFPGFDEPSFKQPWDISLVVPKDDVAVANSAQASSKDLGDGFKKVSFKRTEALPSYLIAFAVGPWDLVEALTSPPTAAAASR